MTTPTNNLASFLSSVNVSNEITAPTQQLILKTDSLELARQVEGQLKKNTARELILSDSMQKVSSISLQAAELSMQNPEASSRLRYLADYFTYLTAQDLL